MTMETQELLLKDLCARLPYHCQVFYEYVDDLDNKTYGYSLTLNTWCINQFINNKAFVKPYLRPMKPSEVTEQELKEIETIDNDYESVDWLNAHHFDYRGLIEKGLALEAPTGMYD